MRATYGGITLDYIERGMGIREFARWSKLIDRLSLNAGEGAAGEHVPALCKKPRWKGSLLDLEWQRNRAKWLERQRPPRR